MDKPMPDSHFKMMSFEFKLRDFFSPRKKILSEIGIKTGDTILDFGCGPGSYTTAAAEMVGSSGKVYGLDIHQLAVDKVKNLALKRGLKNIETILSDCKTGLKDNSVDVVLLYDIFHDLSEPNKILKELYRVLKPEGFLSVNDHHLNNEEIVSGISRGGFFKHIRSGEKTISFKKNGFEKK